MSYRVNRETEKRGKNLAAMPNTVRTAVATARGQ